MKSKLTLSLPEMTVREAKKIAKDRHTTVSALFAESLKFWRVDKSAIPSTQASQQNEMGDLLGAFAPKKPFDARSARIRQKHG